MLTTFAKFEIKNIMREQMTLVMLLWPFAFGGICRLLLEKNVLTGNMAALSASAMITLCGFVFGALSGFSLLDDRDDDVIKSISISPISVSYYIWFKIIFTMCLSFFSTFCMFFIIGVFKFSLLEIAMISLLSAMQVPFVSFIVNAFAKNKVEGFISVKGTGFLMICPMFSWLFLDWKEWLFSIAPGYWPIKAIQVLYVGGKAEMNLGFWAYIGIGFVWIIVLIFAANTIFKKKN